MNFEFDRAIRQKLGYKLIDRINEYFESLPHRPVQLPLGERTFDQLSEHIPEIGADAGDVLESICTELIDKGFHVPAANYFGLMNPTPTYMAVLAEALVAALNPQLASLARSQLASKIESESVRWIGERILWTDSFDGTFTSGGNEANFSALALALAAKFPGVVEDGVARIGEPVAYASAESHHSLDKSVGLLGLGRRALRRIPVDDQIHLDEKLLVQSIERDLREGRKPFCVIATAGTTNSGAIDDIESLAALCRRYGLWLHVDGAYGGAAIFSDRHRNLVHGIELADSITIDPHKWLAMPFAAGVVLTRHPQNLRNAFEVSTPYMPRTDGAALIDNFKVSAQWSRRMNSLKFYLTLRVHGRAAYEELIDRQLSLAAQAADWFKQSDIFELASPQTLPILNFRLKGLADEAEAGTAHRAIVDAVTEDGSRWISQTVVNGRSVLRMMIISYLTGEEQLRGLQASLVQAAERLQIPR